MARKSNYDDCAPAKPKNTGMLGSPSGFQAAQQSRRYSTGWKR
jgi:hypothetical protein